MSPLVPLALLLAVQAQQPAQRAPESPVARIVVTPATREVTAGDTVRFSAEARDASGARIENVTIRFVAQAGEGEGSIDSTGTLIASSVGEMPIHVVAIVPGTRPKVESIEIRMVPRGAVRVDIRTSVGKIVVVSSCGSRPSRSRRPTTDRATRSDGRARRLTWRASMPTACSQLSRRAARR
jgi:hypothetical protein